MLAYCKEKNDKANRYLQGTLRNQCASCRLFTFRSNGLHDIGPGLSHSAYEKGDAVLPRVARSMVSAIQS